MAEIERSKLIAAARWALRRIEISEEVIGRLDDVIGEEHRSVRSERSSLAAILTRAGITFGDGINDMEDAAHRFVDGTDDG